jgi:hypothetical protein
MPQFEAQPTKLQGLRGSPARPVSVVATQQKVRPGIFRTRPIQVINVWVPNP